MIFLLPQTGQPSFLPQYFPFDFIGQAKIFLLTFFLLLFMRFLSNNYKSSREDMATVIREFNQENSNDDIDKILKMAVDDGYLIPSGDTYIPSKGGGGLMAYFYTYTPKTNGCNGYNGRNGF